MRISAPETNDCQTDFVKVMDGDCVSRLGESKFCGNDIPSKFESTTNRLCVKFYSDDSQNDQGFSASYEAISIPTQQTGELFCYFLAQFTQTQITSFIIIIQIIRIPSM